METKELEQIMNEWKAQMNDKNVEPIQKVVAQILYNIALNTEMGTKEASTRYSADLNSNPRTNENSLYNMINGQVGGFFVVQQIQENLGGTTQWNPIKHRFNYQPQKVSKK